MVTLLRQYIRHPIIKPAGLIVFSSLAINAANYFFTFIVGRLLSPHEFAEITALFSLFLIVSVPSQTIATTAAKTIGELYGRQKFDRAKDFINLLSKLTLRLSLIVILGFYIISPWLSQYLHIQLKILLIFGLILPFSLMSAVYQGSLQGLHRFFHYSIFNSLQPFIKLGLSLLLISIGWSVPGVLVALIMGTVMSVIYGEWHIRQNLLVAATSATAKKSYLSRYVLPAYARTILYATLLLALLSNGDVILAKHYLPAFQAGQYAALSVLGKIILYGVPGFSAVLLPMVAATETHESQKRRRMLYITLLPVVLVATLIIIGFALWPDAIVRVVIGPKYLEIVPYLAWFGLAMLLNALAILFINYLVAIHNSNLIIPLIIAVMIEFSLIFVFHNSLHDFTVIVLLAQSILLTGLSYVYLAERYKKIQ
jgi:O-antigen/teichoic acid export membrane protein